MYHIAFEGLDGSGKSTLVKNLCTRFLNRGYKNVVMDVDRPVIKETLGDDYRVLNHYFDVERSDVNFFLYAALAATELLRDREKIPNDAILLSDRDIASLYIYTKLDTYQFLPLKAYMKIAKIIYNAYPKPDMTFFIHVAMREVRRRVEEREKNIEYYAIRSDGWWKKLYDGYQKWYEKHKGENLTKIESTNPLVVEEQVLFELKKRGFNV